MLEGLFDDPKEKARLAFFFVFQYMATQRPKRGNGHIRDSKNDNVADAQVSKYPRLRLDEVCVKPILSDLLYH